MCYNSATMAIQDSYDEQVLTHLQELEPAAQAELFDRWLDATVPSRMSATIGHALIAADLGDKEGERALTLEAWRETERAKDYVERQAAGKLTMGELALKKALGMIFPDRWPFKTTRP